MPIWGRREAFSLCARRCFPNDWKKGVIRRARIAGWFLPLANDLAAAAALAQAFVGEPLPLTT
jgi:hypothetical protein